MKKFILFLFFTLGVVSAMELHGPIGKEEIDQRIAGVLKRVYTLPAKDRDRFLFNLEEIAQLKGIATKMLSNLCRTLDKETAQELIINVVLRYNPRNHEKFGRMRLGY